jgi:hypothetical protein
LFVPKLFVSLPHRQFLLRASSPRSRAES